MILSSTSSSSASLATLLRRENGDHGVWHRRRTLIYYIYIYIHPGGSLPLHPSCPSTVLTWQWRYFCHGDSLAQRLEVPPESVIWYSSLSAQRIPRVSPHWPPNRFIGLEIWGTWPACRWSKELSKSKAKHVPKDPLRNAKKEKTLAAPTQGRPRRAAALGSNKRI